MEEVEMNRAVLYSILANALTKRLYDMVSNCLNELSKMATADNVNLQIAIIRKHNREWNSLVENSDSRLKDLFVKEIKHLILNESRIPVSARPAFSYL